MADDIQSRKDFVLQIKCS